MVISQQALASHDRWSRDGKNGRETEERREEREGGGRTGRDGGERDTASLPQVVASVSRLPDPALELDRARDHGLFPTVYPVLTYYIHVALHKLYCTYISTAHLLFSINIRIEY